MIFGLFKKKEDRATLRTPTSWLFNSLTGGVASSGVAVNETTALTYSAVFAAVRLLSESVASLPLHTYQRGDEAKSRVYDNPVARLLSKSPNPKISSFTFRETLMGHVLTWGNGYAEIVRDGSGNPVQLLPITPDRVRVDYDSEGNVKYVVDEQVTLRSDDMFHIAGLGFDGLFGYSPIQLAKNSIGLGLGAEQFGGSFFGNSARPAGVLSHPSRLSREAAENLRETWRQAFSGVSNAGRTAILEEGMSWQALGLSNEDAQYLQTREYQITEIARWYGIPPHMLASMKNATFSNIEHQGIEFVTYSLRPWLVRWESEIARKLHFDDTYFSEFIVDGLLRGDTKTRYDGYRIARETGWLSVNEIRSLENLNPVEGGDQYIQPLNMGTVVDETVIEDEERTNSRALPRAHSISSISWATPLVEDALFRSKRLQQNAERKAQDRKGEHYDEWRSNWIVNDLPATVIEILSPAIEAVARSNGCDQETIDNFLDLVAHRWIHTNKGENQFASQIIGELTT